MSAGSARDPVAMLKRRLAGLPERLHAEANAALLEAGEAAVAAARQRLAGADGPGPSRPGTPPRDPDGRLAAALTATLDETRSRVAVTATSPQAVFLEYGTRTMAPRPFLRPAVEEARPEALASCRAALARVGAGAAR